NAHPRGARRSAREPRSVSLKQLTTCRSGPAVSPMKKTFVRLSLLTFASCAAMAQTTSPVAQSVQKAIEGNPEVAAKFNAFRASNDEIDVTAGDWKPHLDASGAAGRRNYENTQSA